MPTLLLPILPTQVKINYREPLTTAPLNQKLAGVLPSGVYRGFKLGLPLAAEVITVIADAVVGDQLAVIETITGFSLTVKLVGNFTISLTPFIGSTVLIALFGSYVVGPPTTVELRAYTVAEYTALTAAQQLELAVLGTVVVVAGIIPDANITADRRDGSWQRTPAESLAWVPLLRNPSFELGSANAVYPRAAFFWETIVLVGGSAQGILRAGGAIPRTGDKAMALQQLVAGPVTISLRQYVFTPVTAGQQIRLQLFYSELVLALGGAATGDLVFLDSTGAVVSTLSVPIPLTTFSVGYQKIDKWFSVPVGAFTLAYVSIQATAMDWGVLATDVVRFDDVQVWVEALSALTSNPTDSRDISSTAVSELIIEDPAAPFSPHAPTLQWLSVGSGTLLGGRRDGTTTGLTQLLFNWLGRMTLGQGDLDTTAKANLARLSTAYSETAGVTYTLIWISNPVLGGALPRVRLYVASVTHALPGSWVLTVNATWSNNTSLWSKDVAGVVSSKLELQRDAFNVLQRDISAGTWTDAVLPVVGGWTSSSLQMVLTTLLSTFAGRLQLGGELLATTANALLPRIRAIAAAGAGRTLLYDSDDGIAAGHVRLYILGGAPQIFELTINARSDGSATPWIRDQPAAAATKFAFGSGGFTLSERITAGSPWTDSAPAVGGWDSIQTLQGNGTVFLREFLGAALTNTLTILAANLSKTTAAANTLAANNIVKAWGHVSYNGSGTITFENGVNVASVLSDGGSGHRITFPVGGGMLDTFYGVTITNMQGGPAEDPTARYTVRNSTRTTGLFDIFSHIDSTGAAVNINTAGVPGRYSFIVMGQQP